MKVKALESTGPLGGRSPHFRARKMALLPELSPRLCFTPKYSLKARSVFRR